MPMLVNEMREGLKAYTEGYDAEGKFIKGTCRIMETPGIFQNQILILLNENNTFYTVNKNQIFWTKQ